MKTEDAILLFGSRRALAEWVGVSPAAVSQWGDEVPDSRETQVRLLAKAWWGAAEPPSLVAPDGLQILQIAEAFRPMAGRAGAVALAKLVLPEFVMRDGLLALAGRIVIAPMQVVAPVHEVKLVPFGMEFGTYAGSKAGFDAYLAILHRVFGGKQ